MYSLFQGHKCKIHIFFFHPFVNQTKIFIISHFLSFQYPNTPKRMFFFLSPFPQLQPQLKCLLKTPICAKFTICFLKKWRFETMIAQPILKNSRVTQKTRFSFLDLIHCYPLPVNSFSTFSHGGTSSVIVRLRLQRKYKNSGINSPSTNTVFITASFFFFQTFWFVNII